MKRSIKGIALAFFATVLPCLGWATEATWTTVTLPATANLGQTAQMAIGTESGYTINNLFTTLSGKTVGVYAGPNSATHGYWGSQGGNEGHWVNTDNYGQISLCHRSGRGGASFGMVLQPTIATGTEIKGIRLSLANEANSSLSTVVPLAYGIGISTNAETIATKSTTITSTTQALDSAITIFDSNYTWTGYEKILVMFCATPTSGGASDNESFTIKNIKVEYLTATEYLKTLDYSRILTGTGDQAWNTDWDSTVDGVNLPSSDSTVGLYASAADSLTMDTTATIASLETLGEKITFVAGDSGSLTSTTTTINADTDVSGITASLDVVTVAEGKTLTIDDSTTITSATEGSTFTIDGTEEGKTLNDATRGVLRTANGKIIARGSGETGVALPFAISTAATPNNNSPAVPALNNRIIFSGGKHTMQAGHTNNWNVFTNLTTSYTDPLIWVKDNASLEFTMRDSSGGINTVSAGRALRVDAGSTLTFKSNGTNTGRFAEQLHLCGGDSEETGAKLVINNNGLDNYFYIHGSDATETMSNIVVPGSESATYASITGDTILSDSSAGYVTRKAGAMNIGANATLHVANPIGGSAAFYKFGAGTLKLSGINTITGQVEVNAGTLELAATTFSGDSTKTFVDSKVINTAAGTTVKLTSGGGYFNIQGAGTVVADGDANFIYGMGEGSGNTISANIDIPVGKSLNIRPWSGCVALGGGNITVNGSIVRNGGNDGALKVTVADGKTLSGNGSIDGAVTFADGAILNATAGALTATGTVTKQGALTIKVADTAAEDTIVLTCNTSTINTENITLVDAEGVEIDTLEVQPNDTGTALVLAAVATPTVCTLDGNSYETLELALQAIAGENYTGNGEIALTDSVTLTETIQITKDVTIDLAGKTITCTALVTETYAAVPIFEVASGTLTLTTTVENTDPNVDDSDVNLVVAMGDTVVVSGGTLIIDENVYVEAGAYPTAVSVTSGTVGGTGTIAGALVLANGAIIDATAGALTVTGAVTLPSGETDTVIVKTLPTATADEVILNCTTADLATDKFKVTYNSTVDANDNGDALVLVAPTAIVCTGTLGENTLEYTSIAKAIEAGCTSITVTAPSFEDVVIPDTVTVCPFGQTITGDVTVQSGATLWLYFGGGTVIGNVTFESGSTFRITSGALTVDGVASFPETGTFNLVVPTAPTVGASIAIITSTPAVEDGEIPVETLSVTVGEDTDTESYKLVTTAATSSYDVTTVTTPACTLDDVGYASLEAAVTAANAEGYEGNRRIVLTSTMTITSTIVVDVGAANTLTIDLNSNFVNGECTLFRIESGTLNIVTSQPMDGFGYNNMVMGGTVSPIIVGADGNGDAVSETCALVVGEKVTLSSYSAISVVSGSIGGAGTISAGNLILASGAAIDAASGVLTANTADLPEDALTVKLTELPAANTSVEVLTVDGLTASDDPVVANLTVIVGNNTYTEGYNLVATDSGYAVVVAPVCQIGDVKFATLQDAVDSIDTTPATLTTTTLTLTSDITADQTVVVNVGSALEKNKRYGNTLVIDLAGHTITSTANPAFLVECGILKFESSTAATVSATGEGPAVVVGTGDSTKAYTGLRVGANVTVTSAIDTSVAVVVGHIGGAGTIKGLNLADETVIDISTGDLLTVTDSLTFPPQVEASGELQNGRVDIYLPEGATFPAPFINFTDATQAEADKVNTYGKHPGDIDASYNFAPVLTRDNTTGDISGYAIMQYTWITESGELYTTIAEAYADGATELTQYENTSEYVTVPAGVTVNSLGFTINGNVTVQNGGKYVSYGTINGNLVLQAGSEIDISTNLGNTDETGTWELMVNGDVIFPEGDTIAEGENAGKPNSETVEVTITVGKTNSTAALGEPLVLIHSPNGTPGDIADGVTMKIIFDESSSAIDNYHVVRTSEYYMLSTTATGACNYDGIEYATIAAALADYTPKSNQTIKLNNVAILSDTIVIDVGEGNTVTLDVTGAGIASTANPAIRVQSGNLKLVNTDTTVTSVASMTGIAVLVGANADGSASETACGLYIGANVNVSTDVETPDVNVVNGTVAGEGTITGELKLGEGTTVDATYGILTAGSVDFPYTSVTDGETTTYTNGIIYVIPPAGEAYPAQFIACTAANADAKAHTDVKVILNGEEATSANFLLVVKYGENDAVLGYAVNGEGWEAIAVVGSEMTYWTQFADAATKAGSEGQVILLTDITLAADKATNIYTNGHNIEITESHALTGTLTLSHNSSITTASETSFSATNIVVEANATVVIDGTIASANPIVNNGIIATSSPLVPTEIDGTLQLANGSGINGMVSTTVGTVVDAGATVTINGHLYGNLTVSNATINGTGAIFIQGTNTLAGAGTIAPTVTLTSGATIDKVGYETNHLVLATLTKPNTADRFTVKAKTLANVMNTKTSAVTAENFVLSMADGSAYEAYVAQTSGTNLVIPVVAVNGSDYTVGIVKLNFALAGVTLGADGGARMASYAYRQGILEVKGVYNDVEAYQLFSNVGTGFTSAGYVMVDYDFGIKALNIITVNATKHVIVTADVDGVNDKTEGNLSGNADYRTGTKVKLLDENGDAIEGAVELTTTNDEIYGLTVTVLPGVKYFIVPYGDLFKTPTEGEAAPPSETVKFTVKATNEPDSGTNEEASEVDE